MARNKGVAQFSVNFEPGGQSPLDARTLVATVSDLTAAKSYGKNIYNGLLVSVQEDNSLWMLTNMSNPTDVGSWKQLNSDISDEEILALQEELAALKTTVGDDGSGLVKDVADLKTTVGDDGSGLVKDVADLKTTVGDNSNGLVKDVADLKTGLEAETQRATTAEENLKSEVESKVASVTSGSNGIEIGGSATEPTVKLKFDNSGNVQFTETADGLKAQVDEVEVPVTDVKSGDKILTIDGTELTSTISLDYVSSAHTIYLKGINSEVISQIDANDFIKDGMLQSAALETNPTGQTAGTYIVLTFNTDAGTNPIYINVTSLIDTYLAGNGLTLSGHTFSVKVKDADKYLKVTSDGVASKGIDEALALKVDKVEGSRLMTNEEGTKLANIESGAQVNVVESVSVNGVDASVEDKKASVSINATQIEIGKDITDNEEVVYSGTTKLDAVLQGIQESISAAVSGGLTSVVAGDGIEVSPVAGNKQTISAKLSSDEGNLLKVGSDQGLFAALYYSGDDVE